MKTGYGEYYYKNGDSYKGMFKAGKFHGEGEYSWSNGAKYVGAHDMDQRTGFGTMIYPDGAEFSGTLLVLKDISHFTNFEVPVIKDICCLITIRMVSD